MPADHALRWALTGFVMATLLRAARHRLIGRDRFIDLIVDLVPNHRFRWLALFVGAHGVRVDWRSPFRQGRLTSLDKWLTLTAW